MGSSFIATYVYRKMRFRLRGSAVQLIERIQAAWLRAQRRVSSRPRSLRRLHAVDIQHRGNIVGLQQDLLLRDAPISLAQHQLVLGAPEERVAFARARID